MKKKLKRNPLSSNRGMVTKSKHRNRPSSFTYNTGTIISAIIKIYNPASFDYEAIEVTAYVIDKTRIMYLCIYAIHDIPNTKDTKYEVRRVYVNPSKVSATKIVDKFRTYRPSTQSEFVQLILNDEEEFTKALQNG